MDVRVEELGPTRRRIHVVIPKQFVKKEIDGIYSELRKTAKVKGFRPGRTPRQILERYYGDYVREQAVSKLINSTYEGALSEGKIRPVSQPALENEELMEGEPFKYSAVVDVSPEIDVKDYLGVSLTRREPKIEEEDVTKRLDQICNLHAQLEILEEKRAVKDGDFVVIDFQGSIDGRPFKGGKGENVTVEIGSGRFLPDFEKALVGTRCDEEKEMEVGFPEDYREREVAGKTALFHVKVREIREKVVPSLDDEFAKDVGRESLKDLEEAVRREVEEEKRAEIDRELENQILDSLIEGNTFEVPKTMVERRIETLIRELKLNLAYQGVEFRTSGLDEEKLKDEYSDRAVREVKSDLLLTKIADLEEIEVLDPEIEQRFEEIASRTNQTKDRVEAYYKKNNLVEGLRAQILNEKTLQFLVSRAEIANVKEP